MVYLLHRVARGEDAESIARRYNIPPCVLPREIAEGNILKIAVGGIGGHTVSRSLEYIIKPADTLEGIAKKFGVSGDKIRRANADIHPYVGERVYIDK